MKTALYFLRTRCNYTQSMVARKLNISRQMFSAWENGTKAIPGSRQQEIAALFGVHAELLKEQDLTSVQKYCDRPMYSRTCEGRQVFSFQPASGVPRVFLGMPQEELPEQLCQSLMSKKAVLLEQADQLLRFEPERQVEQLQDMEQAVRILDLTVGLLDACHRTEPAKRGKLLSFLAEQEHIMAAVFGTEDLDAEDEWHHQQEHLLRCRLGKLNRREKKRCEITTEDAKREQTLTERVEFWYQYAKREGMSSSELQWRLNQILEWENDHELD